MNKILYVSDFFLSDFVGGGELNDNELCSILESLSSEIKRIRSSNLSLDLIREHRDYKIIISNFINLNKSVIDEITEFHSYVIYEHDHKYLKSRNPADHERFTAPEEEIINKEFYRNAKAVFCQSSFHKKIMYNNLRIENIVNLSGNLWSEASLRVIETLSKKEKQNKYSILNSQTCHKNTRETSFYCEKKGFEYDLISSPDYNEFLSLLSNNDKFIFLPKTPETLSRVAVEARMMNIKTITNNNVGASYEEWYKLKGEKLINLMRDKRIEIPSKVMEVLYE